MVIEANPSARFQVRSRGELMHPACCLVCKVGDRDEGYIDLSVFFDYEGTMYLCKLCLVEAAEIFGMYTPDEVQQIITHGEDLAAKVAELTSELEDARPALDYLRRFTDAGANTVGPLIGTTVQVGEPEPERNLKLVDRTDSGEPKSEESVKVDRPKSTDGSKPRNVTFE